ncbi:MAG: hypothetical protein AAGI01_09575 [Myxococcota bacterium]
MSLSEYFESAHTALESGDIPGAARALTAASREADLETRDGDLSSLAESFAELARVAQLPALATAAESADPADPETLFVLGYQLVEFGLPEPAIPYLRRVHLDLPHETRIVTELAAALERSGRHAEARDALLNEPALLSEFWPRYLVCFNAIFAGDLDTAREHAPQLDPSPTIEGSAEAAQRVLDMLTRADALPETSSLDHQDLRGWHYVLNGGLLLHISPFGFDEGMNGRYAFFQDGLGGIRRDLDALAATLDAKNTRPARVLHLDEYGSRVLATALGAMLSVPVERWTPGADGLTVAYDMNAVELTVELVEGLRAGGPLFLRSACWTQPPPTPADYVRFLHQVNTAPWGAVMAFDPESGEMTTSEPSTDPPEAWAQRILDTEPDARELENDTLELLTALATRVPALRGDLFWEEGPVRSSRLG